MIVKAVEAFLASGDDLPVNIKFAIETAHVLAKDDRVTLGADNPSGGDTGLSQVSSQPLGATHHVRLVLRHRANRRNAEKRVEVRDKSILLLLDVRQRLLHIFQPP